MYTTAGQFDKAGKVFTETMEGPGHDGKSVKFRIVTEIKDKDHMQFTMRIVGADGKEKAMMEIEYTRKKK